MYGTCSFTNGTIVWMYKFVFEVIILRKISKCENRHLKALLIKGDAGWEFWRGRERKAPRKMINLSTISRSFYLKMGSGDWKWRWGGWGACLPIPSPAAWIGRKTPTHIYLSTHLPTYLPIYRDHNLHISSPSLSLFLSLSLNSEWKKRKKRKQ